MGQALGGVAQKFWKFAAGRYQYNDATATPARSWGALSRDEKLVNPKYSLREWFVCLRISKQQPWKYSLVRELQESHDPAIYGRAIARHREEILSNLKPLELFASWRLVFTTAARHDEKKKHFLNLGKESVVVYNPTLGTGAPPVRKTFIGDAITCGPWSA